jgi:chromosome segregation ATPase
MNPAVQAALGGAAGGIFSTGVIVALIAYFRDRRVSKAKGDVATQTVDVQVDADRLQVLEKRLVLLNQIRDAERDTMIATIAHLSADLETERRESAAKDRKIADLVQRVESIQSDLDKVRSELADTRRDVDELDS